MKHLVVLDGYKNYEIWRMCKDCGFAHTKVATASDSYEALKIAEALEAK